MGWYEDIRVAPPSVSGGGANINQTAAALNESKFNSLQKGIKGLQDTLMQPYAMQQKALADASISNERLMDTLAKQSDIDRKEKERTALADYNKMLTNYSTSGIIDQSGGEKLATEYNALISGGKSEKEAGDIISQRAKALEEADAKKLKEDPYAVAQRLSGIAMPGEAGIDTKEMIGLRKELVGDYQKKGERAEDVEWRKYQFDETKRLQEKANAIAAGARADALKLQREELQFKKDQLLKPELSAKQKEFKGNLALFGNDEEKAGIATFGADEWKKIKGTYQDESKKKEYAVGGFKSDDILEKSKSILKSDEQAQADAAKTRTTLENMQRAMQLPNSEMDRIVPLVVDEDGEINKDALDALYSNKITLDKDGNIIKMSDAFTKIANNPKDFVTVTNEGKTQLLPVQSEAGKKLIKNMGPEAMDYYGVKPSEPEKDPLAKRLEDIAKENKTTETDPNIRKNIFGGELAPGGKQFNEMIYDKIRGGVLDESWKIVTKPGYFANKSNEEKNKILSGLGEIVLSTPLLSDQNIRSDIKQNNPFIGSIIYNQ